MNSMVSFTSMHLFSWVFRKTCRKR